MSIDSLEYIKQHKAYYAFRLSGILFLFVVSVVAMISGCEPQSRTPRPAPPPPPKPVIIVESSDSQQQTAITVYYKSHTQIRNIDGSSWGLPHVVLDTPEKIQHYRKEVEFLSRSLEEAERKMTIHEDGTQETQSKTTGN